MADNTVTKDRAVIDQATKLSPAQRATLIKKLQERSARIEVAIAALSLQFTGTAPPVP